MARTTIPNLKDQAAPLARPVSLVQLALAQGIAPEYIAAYLVHRVKEEKQLAGSINLHG
jgi:hypothetical protein